MADSKIVEGSGTEGGPTRSKPPLLEVSKKSKVPVIFSPFKVKDSFGIVNEHNDGGIVGAHELLPGAIAGFIGNIHVKVSLPTV